jgi:hypothetical protein
MNIISDRGVEGDMIDWVEGSHKKRKKRRKKEV